MEAARRRRMTSAEGNELAGQSVQGTGAMGYIYPAIFLASFKWPVPRCVAACPLGQCPQGQVRVRSNGCVAQQGAIMADERFHLYRGVTDAEIVFKFVREVVEEIVTGVAAWHDKVSR